jgi:hypothetical protein
LSRLTRKHVAPFMVASLVAPTVLLVLARPGGSQTCMALPARSQEIWLGVASWSGAEAPFREGSFAANVFNRLTVSATAGWGGYEVEEGPSTLALRGGGIVNVAGIPLCGYAEMGTMSYTFRDRFDVDRGEVRQRLVEMGSWVEGAMLESRSSSLGWWLSAGVAYRQWEMRGRSVTVTDEIVVTPVDRARRTYHLVGQGGMSFRWKRVGIAVGVARRPGLASGLLGFARIGFAAVDLG